MSFKTQFKIEFWPPLNGGQCLNKPLNFCDFFFIKSLSYFLDMNNTTRSFCNSKYHWFISNIIGMKFDCVTDKVHEMLHYKECNSSCNSYFHVSVFSAIFLLLFNILFSVFLCFCIWHFLKSIWSFLNLLHDSVCGTKSSCTACETENKKEHWIK